MFASLSKMRVKEERTLAMEDKAEVLHNCNAVSHRDHAQ